MNRILFYLLCVMLFFNSNPVYSQGGTNEANFMSLSPDAMAASKGAATDINLYTGLPTISLPLYSYSHRSGIGLNMTLDYTSGGVRVSESPSSVGLGWNINVGGAITRTVRGMPDEYPVTGFLFSGALPSDPRANANKYYYDSLDSEQDIFQFNFNGRGGKFYIGKNNQVVTVPLSKLKITYSAAPGISTAIGSFRIKTEDGVTYVFSEVERTSVSPISYATFQFGYQNFLYPTAWYLSKIIPPFGSEFIQFNYTGSTTSVPVNLPRTIHRAGGFTTETFNALGTRTINNQLKLSSIVFPDMKRIDFKYHDSLEFKMNVPVLSKLYFSDSIFRYGFYFERKQVVYDTLSIDDPTLPGGSAIFRIDSGNVRAFLSGVQYFTKSATMPGYKFSYSSLLYPASGSYGDTIENKRDHWGFYKESIINKDPMETTPSIPGIYPNGVDRSLSLGSKPIASSLHSITDPSGGKTIYNFENNSIFPYDIVPQTISINAINATQTSITLNQVISNQVSFNIVFGSSLPRIGTPPFSGGANVICTVNSPDGNTIYASKTISLYQLFYIGNLTFNATLPNGNYLFKTTVTSGTTAPGGLPLTITWNNETVGTGTANITGGLRIHSIYQAKPGSGPMNTTVYQYLTPEGKSSGFYGLPPTYHYPVTKVQYTNNANPVTTNETAISSEPVSTVDFTQGNVVGYSRVEVTKYVGDTPGKVGKTIYEFTSPKDALTNVSSAIFPYGPANKREWAVGLPKRTLLYDSSNRLIQSTTNTFSITNTLFENSNFQSLKLGRDRLIKNLTTSNNINTIIGNYFSGQLYFPESGRAELTATIDSFFHPDNSVQVNREDMVYDTNYNITKVINQYDKTRGLSLEKRTYYPYNYTLNGTIGILRDSSIFVPVATEDWVTGDPDPRLIGAQITEYQQLPKGYIKPFNIYSLVSNKPISQEVIGLFNPGVLVRNSTYFKPQQNFVSFDTTGNVTEIKSPNTNQSNSILYSYFNQFAVANISNAKFTDVAYTSFESDGNGNWVMASSIRDKTVSITGKVSYNLTNGTISKGGLNSAVTYLVTYWTTASSPVTISGSTTPVLLAQQGSWRLYSHTCTGVITVTVSGTAVIDELRLHPKDANMVTTNYEPMVGATSTADANNTIGYTEYDSLNRVVLLRDKDKYIIKKNEFSNTIRINWQPVWTITGYRCLSTKNAQRNRIETDVNPFSESFGTGREMVDPIACASCPRTCNAIDENGNLIEKDINCECQIAVKNVTAIEWVKVCGPSDCIWTWRCTFHYLWSDGSIGATGFYYSPDPCYVSGGPE